MLEFIILLAIIVLMIVISYLPALWQHFALKRTKKNFECELSELDALYISSRIVITERLGEGTSQNSDVRFAEAHQNQSFAMNTIMDVLSKMIEE